MNYLTGKLSDWLFFIVDNWLTFWILHVFSRGLAGLLSDRYCCPTSWLPEWLSNWQTDWLVYHFTGCWFTCSLDAEQINFKESSSFSSRELRLISRKKTNYHQEPRIHALAGHLDSLCSAECWLHSSVGADLLVGLQMKLKPALFCSNVTILKGSRDER